MKYQVVEIEDNKGDFEKAVEAEIKKGWCVQGGVSISCTKQGDEFFSSIFTYAQAMIREV